MANKRKISQPIIDKGRDTIKEKVSIEEREERLIVNFSQLKLEPICLPGEFNNHFKDGEHFQEVAANFLGVILPKIYSHTYSEICQGGSEGRMIHYHTVDEKHREIVRKVLEEYKYPPFKIDQMFEGNNIVEFSACLGHVYAARVVCHKVKNVLYVLFLDTNHHIYMNEKYTRESLFYEDCPKYLSEMCTYMPTECFAVSYLDEALIKESFGFSTDITELM